MIYHFNSLGYEPIVGDSFTGDTPLFIKYKKTGEIDIKPIEEILDENEIRIDELNASLEEINVAASNAGMKVPQKDDIISVTITKDFFANIRE